MDNREHKPHPKHQRPQPTRPESPIWSESSGKLIAAIWSTRTLFGQTAMTGEVTIRTATMDDFSAVCQWLHELDDLHVRLRPDVFRPFNGPTRSREVIAQFIDEDDGEIFLAEVGNDIVGLATIQVTDRPGAPMFWPRQNAIDPSGAGSDLRAIGIGCGGLVRPRSEVWQVVQASGGNGVESVFRSRPSGPELSSRSRVEIAHPRSELTRHVEPPFRHISSLVPL